MADQEEPIEVGIDQLRPGIFISLASRWLDHPFLFNEFRLSSERQIETLRGMGLQSIACYPSRSTVAPLPAPKVARPAPVPVPPTAEELAIIEAKHQRAERVADVRTRLARCEKVYAKTAAQVKTLMQRLHASPREAAEMARELVTETVASFLGQEDMVIHLMSQKQGDENAYFHALNVMILSLVLGKAAGQGEQGLYDIGLGALFHDLGKVKIPDRVLRKGTGRTKVEEDFYRIHTVYGDQIGRETQAFTPAALDVIRHHHERMDGSGFPDGFQGNAISLPARLVAIVNRYDNLCNAPEGPGYTPAEVLSQMFRKEGKWWDQQILSMFIKNLGVYPPGSLVQLSNGAVGLVIAVNHAELLRPSVMLYDASIDRKEALIVDLVDVPDVKIERALRRDQIDKKVLDYLAPRRQLSYFYDRPAKQG